MLGTIWHDSRLMNVVAGLLSLVALSMIVVGIFAWLAHRSVFELKAVQIGGDLKHVNAAAVRANAVPKLRGNFFTMDLEAARAAFETVPWVRKAGVRRVWPNKLSVEIEEQVAVAQWGESALVNGFGETFIANIAEAEADGDLPILHGPPGSEQLVLKRYVDLKSWLEKTNRNLDALHLSDRFAWSVLLSGGLRLELGREQTPTTMRDRITLFLKSYPIVMSQVMKSLQVFDLRYPNGFALRGQVLPPQHIGAASGANSQVAVRAQR